MRREGLENRDQEVVFVSLILFCQSEQQAVCKTVINVTAGIKQGLIFSKELEAA